MLKTPPSAGRVSAVSAEPLGLASSRMILLLFTVFTTKRAESSLNVTRVPAVTFFASEALTVIVPSAAEIAVIERPAI